jgi:hypothetical protein
MVYSPCSLSTEDNGFLNVLFSHPLRLSYSLVLFPMKAARSQGLAAFTITFPFAAAVL